MQKDIEPVKVAARMTRFLSRRAVASILFLYTATSFAQAHEFTKGDLVLDHPYAVPSLSGTKTGLAYLRAIKNTGDKPDRLLEASTNAANHVELHRMKLEAGVMRMREVPAIELPPKTVTVMRHDGEYHLMLVDLKHPLKAGDQFDLTLKFERAGNQTVKVLVQTPREGATAHH